MKRSKAFCHHSTKRTRSPSPSPSPSRRDYEHHGRYCEDWETRKKRKTSIEDTREEPSKRSSKREGQSRSPKRARLTSPQETFTVSIGNENKEFGGINNKGKTVSRAVKGDKSKVIQSNESTLEKSAPEISAAKRERKRLKAQKEKLFRPFEGKSATQDQEDVSYLEALVISKALKQATTVLLIPKLKDVIYHSNIPIERVNNFIAAQLSNPSFTKKPEFAPFDLAKWELSWMVRFMDDTFKLWGEDVRSHSFQSQARHINRIRNELEHNAWKESFWSAVEQITHSFKVFWKMMGSPTNESCGLSEEDTSLLLHVVERVFKLKEVASPLDWVSYFCSII